MHLTRENSMESLSSDFLAELDGIPQMSANCVAILDEKLSDASRYLEWGSGNSTLYVLNKHRHLQEIISIEHHPGYFRAVLEKMGTLLEDQGKVVFTISDVGEWLRPMAEIRSRCKDLESEMVKFHYLTRTRTLVCGSISFKPFHILYRTLRLVFKSRIHKRRNLINFFYETEKIGTLMESIKNWHSKDMVITMRTKGQCLHYFLLHHHKVGRKGMNDGLYADFYDYVDIKLNRNYDVILVDGRARCSVLKRIYKDSLIAPGGSLLCHDAYRVHIYEALKNFNNIYFVNGSNRRISGVPFTSQTEAFILNTGEVKDEICVC